MKLDLTRDPCGREDIELTLPDGSPLVFKNVDVWKLSNQLSDAFQKGRDAEINDETEFARMLNAVYQQHEMNLPTDLYLLPNTLGQRIIHETSERRKKFERTLWASGEDAPAWGVFTPDSTPDLEPPTAPTV